MPNIADPSICEWSPAPYLIFSDNIWGNFIYYSHLFPSLTALFIAVFVFRANPRGLPNRALLFIAVMFTLWSLIDLVLWATDRSDLIMFFWSSLIYFELLVYVGCLYFMYGFISGAYPSWKREFIIFLAFIPLFVLGHTGSNLLGFDFTNCWREALEGPLWQFYIYPLELFFAIWILGYAGTKFFYAKEAVMRRKIVLVTIGVLAFLISFSFGNITGSIETDWELGQYGLFGMPVFAAFLTYLIVRYQVLDARIIGTEALVVGLGILIASLLFVRTVENIKAIAVLTLVLTVILGALLIRSVRREVQQRQQIEKLAVSLQRANERLRVLDKMKSEFVSIASHQLRSPLTAIRGYASMLLEGSYGKLPAKMSEAIERIQESSRYMAISVEDYLNVSRIEAGNMKYELSDFNLLDEVQKVIDELRPTAFKKGLRLDLQSCCKGRCIVHADIGKSRQVIQNLVDNAIKYTQKGSIVVTANDDVRKKKMFISITDTGVGMNDETLEDLFEKFVRARNANLVNVTGTGLGLFVAKKMIEGMGGGITATSPGVGEGSTFTIELPLAGRTPVSR